MTKGELVKALEQFQDDQFVMVLTEHGQTMIQGVVTVPPWYPSADKGEEQCLIALRVHTRNKELGPWDHVTAEQRALQVESRIKEIAGLRWAFKWSTLIFGEHGS